MEPPASPVQSPAARVGMRRLTRWLALAAIVAAGCILLAMFGSKKPANLGLRDGKLAACPDKPNCVSTQAEDDVHRLAPLSLLGEPAAAMSATVQAVKAMPRTKLASQDGFYLHAECSSAIFRFVDDLEVWIDVEHRLIHGRSASRVGYSDLGTNRGRVEQLFKVLIQAGVGQQL